VRGISPLLLQRNQEKKKTADHPCYASDVTTANDPQYKGSQFANEEAASYNGANRKRDWTCILCIRQQQKRDKHHGEARHEQDKRPIRGLKASIRWYFFNHEMSLSLCRLLQILKLNLMQSAIERAASDQFIMAAYVEDAAGLHDDNAIGQR
jgi:hypothetical protein